MFWPAKFAWLPPGLVIVAGRREIESIRTTNNIWQSAGLQTRKEKKSLVMTTWIKKMKKGDEKTEKALSSLYNGISGVCTPYISTRDIQSSDSPENLRPISCRYVECLSWQGPVYSHTMGSKPFKNYISIVMISRDIANIFLWYTISKSNSWI